MPRVPFAFVVVLFLLSACNALVAAAVRLQIAYSPTYRTAIDRGAHYKSACDSFAGTGATGASDPSLEPSFAKARLRRRACWHIMIAS
jgi:hypothetical protein